MTNPYQIVDQFEQTIAEFAGSKYAVAVESCTAAIFLSCMWIDIRGREISIPKRTYPGVACSIIHAGGKVRFSDHEWKGDYHLYPLGIVDAALRFKRGMYLKDTLYCLSFHIKKNLPIGRGGMILTDNENAYEWFKKARFDGRSPVPLQEDNLTMLGWNMYMEPANAARGIQLFQTMLSRYPDGMEDLRVEDQKYADLSQFKIYRQ